MTIDTALSDIPLLLVQLGRDRFYGSLEIKLEAGRIVLLKKTETIKPTEEESSVNILPKQSGAMNGKSRR
jgi:hypothetical protein